MPDATKTVKVDDAVHSELERLKSEYDVDTFNAVLRRELDIVPGPDLDNLTAYLPDELRTAVADVVATVEDFDSFEQRVAEEPATSNEFGDKTYLQFIDPPTNRVIVEIAIAEDEFAAHYRNQQGEMARAGGGKKYPNDGQIKYGTTSNGHFDHFDADDVVDSTREKVKGAVRRWVEE